MYIYLIDKEIIIWNWYSRSTWEWYDKTVIVCGTASAGRGGCTLRDRRSETQQCHLRSDKGVVGPCLFVLLFGGRTNVLLYKNVSGRKKPEKDCSRNINSVCLDLHEKLLPWVHQKCFWIEQGQKMRKWEKKKKNCVTWQSWTTAAK